MKILLLAGEDSGVMYAEELKAHLAGHEVRGYRDYGFKTEDLAVMGVGQVLKRLFFFLGVKRTMMRAIDEWRPDVVCTIDYPGMNLKLAAYAKSMGIRTVHVVCPQVWAWKRGRIPKIEASLDRLCCFFPFEPRLFRPGFATFVGHPLADAFGGRGESVERGLVAVLPGSRIGEIELILPTLLEATKNLNCRLAIPAANDRAYETIRRIAGDGVEVTRGGARELLKRADCAAVASGTATLEAALARCPTVLVYRVGWLFAFLARRFIRGVRHIGLANIIAEKAFVPCPMPELLQEAFTAGAVRAQLERWLTDSSARAEAVARLDATMKLLQSDGCAMDRIAKEVVNGVLQ